MSDQAVRRAILHNAVPVTKILGHVGFWWLNRLVTEADVDALRAKLEPGDALLSTKRFELTNVFIEGFWSHQAMYVGSVGANAEKGDVIEAVGTGVRRVWLKDFMLAKDYVAGYDPTFASPKEKIAAALWAASKVGLPYDFLFEYGLTAKNAAFYCAELYGAAYLDIVGGQCAFLARETMGVETFLPQDTADAVEKFRFVGANARAIADGVCKPLPALGSAA